MNVHQWHRDRHSMSIFILGMAVSAAALVVLAPGLDQGLQTVVANLAAVVLSLAAAFACLFTARGLDRQTSRGWLYIGVGTAAWAGGEVLWFYFETIRGVDAPFPSLADASYLAAYPLLLAGVLQLAIPQRRAARLRTMLDASLIALMATALTWAYVFEPIVHDNDATTWETLLGLSYPAGDLLLVFGLAVAVLRRPKEHSGLILATLGLGLMLFLVADFAFAVLSQSDSFASGSYLDVLWLAGYALIAMSAVWQHQWRVDHLTNDHARVSAAWRQAVPLVLMIPAFVWAWARTGDYVGPWVPGLLVVALAVVVVRSILAAMDMLSLNKELDESASQLEAANKELTANGRLLNKLLVEAVALSRRDSLTGLLNHASAMEELTRALKDNPGVVVAMLDVDRMKHINDEGGHQAGDAALRLIAKLLEAQEDLVAGRYGGDEFIVFQISPDASLEVMEHQLAEVDGVLALQGISLSHGVAVFPVDALEVAELVHRADQRLYRAKRAHRGQVTPGTQAA